MANSLGSLNNLLRRTKHTSQAEINSLKLKFAEISDHQETADAKIGFKKIRELLLDTVSLTSGDPDIDESTTLRNSAYSFIMKPSTSTHSAYPVSHTTTGTIDFNIRNGTKYGAIGKFNGTQYIKIPHHVDVDTGLNQSWAFWFKTTAGGTRTIFNKKDGDSEADYNATDYLAADYRTVAGTITAGVSIFLQSLQADQYDATDFLSDDYQQDAVPASVNCRVADGVQDITASEDLTWNNGTWHSIVVTIGDIGDDYDSNDYQSADYQLTASEIISIYADGALLGTTSISLMTNAINNSRDSYIAALDEAGILTNKFIGSLAWFFWEQGVMELADAVAFNTGQMNSNQQISAVFFDGDESESDFNSILT